MPPSAKKPPAPSIQLQPYQHTPQYTTQLQKLPPATNSAEQKKRQQTAIEKCNKELLERMNFDHVVTHLKSISSPVKFLTPDDLYALDREKPTDKILFLLKACSQRDNGWQILLAGLKYAQQSDLVDMLDKELERLNNGYD